MMIYRAGQNFDEFAKYLKIGFQLAMVAANFFLITKALQGLRLAFAGVVGIGKAVVKFFKEIGSLGGVVKTAASGLKDAFKGLGSGTKDIFKSLSITARNSLNAVKSFLKGTQRSTNEFGKVTKLGFRSVTLLLKRLGARFKFLGDAAIKTGKVLGGFAIGVGKVFTSAFGKALTVLGKVKEGIIFLASGALSFLGIDKLTEAVGELNDESSDTTEALKAWRIEMAGLQTGLDDTVKTTDKVVIATAKQINAIQSAADAYHEETKAIIENLKMQNALIGKSDEQKRVMEALHEEGQRFRAEELRLTNAVADAKAQGTDEELAKIPFLQAQLEKLRNTHQGTLDVIEQLVVANTGLTDQYQLQQFAIKTNIDLQNQLTKLQLDTANIGLTTLEKKYADVDAAATASAKAAIEAEEARRGAPLNNAEVESYYAKAREGSVLLKEGIKEAYDESRTFDAGWKESMNSYVETITSSANLAKGAFESMTSNMESSIDDFVESGKFSFGDLAKSIIKDIQKMILKMVIFNALKAAGTAFGIPGFAEGGNVKAGGPIMVGEKGPELFVPPSSGKIIPNNQLGKGGSGATVQSAPVTNNYITNNIQAMDSRSVAEVFAENRKTLLGTVRMAENEMPY